MPPVTQKNASDLRNESLKKFHFRDLVNVAELQNLAEVNFAATGMPTGIIDVETGEIYSGAGWQKICTKFHRAHPETNALCIKSDTAILKKIRNGKPYGYKCANGLWDIGVPIYCLDKHIATYFLGQFHYDDEPIDFAFFSRQAKKYGFDEEEYLAALREVPRFSREKVDEILKHNIAMSGFLSNLASRNMERLLELEQRKQTEEELRKLRNFLSNIINSMPSVLIGVDPDGYITQWNYRAEELTAISQKEALGKSIELLVPQITNSKQRINKAIATREQQLDLKQVFINGGNKRYEDVTIYPLIANGIEGAVVRIDDVTERVNLELFMIQSEKMLSIGGLAAGMAHEINNPLTAILGYVHSIKMRVFGELTKNEATAHECGIPLDRIHEYLEKRGVDKMLDGIHDSADRAATIVKNMLGFSRKSENKFGSHSLAEILDDTISLLAVDSKFKQQYNFGFIDIVRDYDPHAPNVSCECNEIKQVFFNILKNASEAISEKQYVDEKPRLTLRVKPKGPMVLVEIEDNGSGMDETTRKRALEPFYTTKPAGKGTGLGLSVSYFIIADQHKGTMTVDSEYGKWTRFSIQLPINKAAA